jgi:hypothetical protein
MFRLEFINIFAVILPADDVPELAFGSAFTTGVSAAVASAVAVASVAVASAF